MGQRHPMVNQEFWRGPTPRQPLKCQSATSPSSPTQAQSARAASFRGWKTRTWLSPHAEAIEVEDLAVAKGSQSTEYTGRGCSWAMTAVQRQLHAASGGARRA